MSCCRWVGVCCLSFPVYYSLFCGWRLSCVACCCLLIVVLVLRGVFHVFTMFVVRCSVLFVVCCVLSAVVDRSSLCVWLLWLSVVLRVSFVACCSLRVLVVCC